MGRTARRAGGTAAVVVVVLALGAAACTGQGGGADATVTGSWPRPVSTVNGAVLSEPAPPSAQWIVDELSEPGAYESSCPVPTRTDMIVLDSDDRHRTRAAVVWLGDGLQVCLAGISHGADGGGSTVSSGPLGDLTRGHWSAWMGRSFFAVFPGDAGTVVMEDDDDHLYGPVHQRVADFGAGRRATFVQYAFPGPLAPSGSPSGSPRARLCPSAGGGCRPAQGGR